MFPLYSSGRVGRLFKLVGSLYLWLGLASALPAQAQEAVSPVLFGESTQSARRLAEADQLVGDQKWSEALEAYQQIIESSGDDLIPVQPDRRRCIQAKRLCQLHLVYVTTSSPIALATYRQRIDGQAKKWLEQAEPGKDTKLLRRIVEEAFCSSSTPRALDLLGDLAFERGEFVAAESWWRMLAPPVPQDLNGQAKTDPQDSLVLVYPNAPIDLAQVRGKQILARLFSGERSDLKEGLDAFRKFHGQASGHLAGQDGKYAEILQSFAAHPEALGSPPGENSWTTFAGAPSRNQVLPREPGRLHGDFPLEHTPWPQPLENEQTRPNAQGQNEVPTVPGSFGANPNGAPSLAFFPVIVGNNGLLADARSVMAFNLLTGKKTTWFDLVADGQVREPQLSLNLPAPPDLRYTLTVAENRVFARLGAQGLGPPKEGQRPGENDTFLVCLNLVADKEGKRQRWLIMAGIEDRKDEQVYFEGAPVVHNGRVFAILSRFSGGKETTSIACYYAQSGALCWRQPVAISESHEQEGEGRFRHHLLTLAGPHIVFCSHSGAILALDEETGHPAWAVRYPSRGTKMADGKRSPRDLAPCLFAGDRLLAAPADYNRIICLEPETGRTLWVSEPPVEVVHLLGVARGKVIFTTPGGIRALDLETGQTIRTWIQPSDGAGRLHPFGRGILAGGLVFWPTEEGLVVLDLVDGQVAEEWYPFWGAGIPLGNMAFAKNWLVVANEKFLWAYKTDFHNLGQGGREATKWASRLGEAPQEVFQNWAEKPLLGVPGKTLAVRETRRIDKSR